MKASNASGSPVKAFPYTFSISALMRVIWAQISMSVMVGPSRKRLVVGTPKHTRLEPAAQHPWRPDPADDRTPIGPPDTSVHEPLLGRIERIQKVVVRKVGLKLKASKHGAQQVIGHILAARHFLADRFGLPEQGFGFCFHGSTVGQINQRRNAEIQGVSR